MFSQEGYHLESRLLRGLVFTVCILQLAGCSWVEFGQQKLAYLNFSERELEYYRDVATRIDEPNVDVHAESAARYSAPPASLREPSAYEIRDLTLAEAIHLALAESEIIRDAGGFLSPGNTLLRNSQAVPSVYDPALQETGVLFGNRSVEAALADFDPTLRLNTLWGRNEQVQNNRFISGGLTPGETLTDETANVVARLEKNLATGGSIALQHDINYSLNNVPSRLFGSVYTGSVRTEFRQPLLAGGGVEYTRIAGPIGQALGGVAGVSQGVVIARINADLSIADFEAAVRNLLKDVEDTYWQLALAYRTWDAEVVSRSSALRTLREVNARFQAGSATAADEAQASGTYYEARARAENALADLHAVEGQLRRLLGLPPGDGSILRPIDEPTTAEIVPDWELSLAEALVNRVELRRQKWEIKSFELQLVAARNVARPRLDFVTGYQVNMFGDELISQGDDDDGVTTQGLNNAYETLFQGDQTGWTVGLEFSMQPGLRLSRTQVRNLEFRLAKAKAGLLAQELEVSHELAHAFRELARHYKTAKTNFNWLQAARRQLQAFDAEYRVRKTTLDLYLRAQVSLAQAEIAYYSSLVSYNRAIAELHYRKGTLLVNNNVYLAESTWDPQAYTLALRRAWSRTHALEADHLLNSDLVPISTGVHTTTVVAPSSEFPDDDLLQPLPPDVHEVAPAPSSVPSSSPVRPAPFNGPTPVPAIPELAPPPASSRQEAAFQFDSREENNQQ